jgi:PAS domain S-box-containing protein
VVSSLPGGERALTGKNVDTKTIRILLVEDDLGDVEMTRALLDQAGAGAFTLDWVSSFEEAMDAFGDEKYDAYVVDYFLEDRNGLDLVREGVRRGIRAPIIMLTGRGNADVDREAKAAGAADYLVKGQFGPEELERSIRRAIQRATTTTSPETDLAPSALDSGRFRAVFDTSPSGIALVDLDGILQEVNEAFAGLFGSSPMKMKGLPFSGLLKEDDVPAALRDHGTVARGEQARLTSERSFRTGDGSTLLVRTTTSLVSSSSGDPDHLVVVLGVR